MPAAVCITGALLLLEHQGLVSHRPARIPNSQGAHPLMLHDRLLVIPGCSQLLKP